MRMMRAGTPRRRQGLLAQPCDARSLRSVVVTHWLKSGAVIRRGVWTLEKRCAATSAARCCSLLRMPKEAFPKFFPAARLQVRFRSSREHVYETASLDTGMDPRTTNVHAGLPRDLWDPGATSAVKLMRERKGYDSQQAGTDKCWREDSQNESCYGGEPVQDTRAPNICARAFGSFRSLDPSLDPLHLPQKYSIADSQSDPDYGLELLYNKKAPSVCADAFSSFRAEPLASTLEYLDLASSRQIDVEASLLSMRTEFLEAQIRELRATNEMLNLLYERRHRS